MFEDAGTRGIDGIGLATGRVAGVWVLDVDPKNGGTISFDDLMLQHGALDDTLEVRTGGGGRHMYWRWSDDHEVRNRNPLVPGIDVRGEGGYVVLPPSEHPDTGARYAWETVSEGHIYEPPDWLTALVVSRRSGDGMALPPNIRNPGAFAKGALRNVADIVRGTREGGRNGALNSAAWVMRKYVANGHIRREAVESELQLAGEESGLSAGECRKTIDSGLGDARSPTLEMGAPVPKQCPGNSVLPTSAHDFVAGAYLDARCRDADGRLLLRRWRGEWLRWEAGAFLVQDEERVDADLLSWLRTVWVPGKEKPVPYGPNLGKLGQR